MRTLTRFAIALLVMAVAIPIAGCTAGSADDTLTSDESAVPEGMPVMYEFYTPS